MVTTKLKRSKRTQENMRRRMKTLIRKVYQFGRDFREVYDIEVALTICQNGRYFTYRSVDLGSWPPPMKRIVWDVAILIFNMLRSKQQASYPLSTNMLPQDMESPLQSIVEENSQHSTLQIGNRRAVDDCESGDVRVIWRWRSRSPECWGRRRKQVSQNGLPFRTLVLCSTNCRP
jgi:hypothetical protein